MGAETLFIHSYIQHLHSSEEVYIGYPSLVTCRAWRSIINMDHLVGVHVQPDCIQTISGAPKEASDVAVVHHLDTERGALISAIWPVSTFSGNKFERLHQIGNIISWARSPGYLRQALAALTQINLHDMHGIISVVRWS